MEKVKEKPKKDFKQKESLPSENLSEEIEIQPSDAPKCVETVQDAPMNLVDTAVFKKQKAGIHVGDIIEYGEDKYQVIKKIAAGGFGAVYSAKNIITNQIVAIKRFFYQKYNEEDGQNDAECYWHRETKILEMQSHSPAPAMRFLGALQVTEFQVPEYYIIMEFVDGLTLDDWFVEKFGDQQALTDDQIKIILMDVIIPLCDHLQYCHENGLIHRDITPRNIIVAEQYKKIIPVLIDWGVSKEVEKSKVFHPPKPYFVKTTDSATGISSLGNPPETISGYEPVAASDIYMMGHILYFLLSGGDVSQIPATAKDYVLDPSKKNPNLSPALVRLVKQMTQYEPADRIPDFKTVKGDILQYFTKQSVHSRKGPQLQEKLKNSLVNARESYQQNAPARQERMMRIQHTTKKIFGQTGENIRNTIQHGNIVEKVFFFSTLGLFFTAFLFLFLNLFVSLGLWIGGFVDLFMYVFTRDLRNTFSSNSENFDLNGTKSEG
jgi:serine/threonine protein kinase